MEDSYMWENVGICAQMIGEGIMHVGECGNVWKWQVEGITHVREYDLDLCDNGKWKISKIWKIESVDVIEIMDGGVLQDEKIVRKPKLWKKLPTLNLRGEYANISKIAFSFLQI